MLVLLTLTALMPVAKAVTYYWDDVRFVEGNYINYPHPDRDFYEISPFSEWSLEGSKLYHTQFEQSISITLVRSAIALATALGTVVGARLGQMYGAAIGFAVGIALGLYITFASEDLFLDEHNCIWWWISTSFVDWLSDNAWWLGVLSVLNPTAATAEILYTFNLCGYLRVGAVTFYDAVGAGNPSDPTDGGGGGSPYCPTLFVWNGSDYIDLGVIDIHGDEDVVREVSVPSGSVGINNYKAQFRLREGWEGLTYSCSHLDQIKLYAIDIHGNQLPCPLVSAVHSISGNVLPQLLLNDDWRFDFYLLETIDLKFIVPYQTDEIQGFNFVIEGHNMYKY